MAKYHLYIRAIPGYPGYYATIEGVYLRRKVNHSLSFLQAKFIMVIIL